MITDSRSLLTETKSSRKESSFPAEMPLIKLILVANWQSPVIARKFLPLCHRNTSLGCVLTNAIGRENLLKYQLDSFILCKHVLAPTYLPPRRSEYVFTLHRPYGTDPIRYVTLHFRDRLGEASLRYRNRAEITVCMCEQKPYPVGFSSRRKSIPPYGVNTALE